MYAVWIRCFVFNVNVFDQHYSRNVSETTIQPIPHIQNSDTQLGSMVSQENKDGETEIWARLQ